KIARRRAASIAGGRPGGTNPGARRFVGTGPRRHAVHRMFSRKDCCMKYVLSGVALAALIAAGLPALAQNSTPRTTTPMPPPATSAAPAGAAQQNNAMPSAGQGMDNQSSGMSSQSSGMSSGTGNARSAHHGRSPQDNMAEQLNREELQRVNNGNGGP